MKQNAAQDISNQFNLAKLTQMKQEQEAQEKSRQLGMQIAQGNLDKQANPAPNSVTLANLSEVPDASAESQGLRSYEVASPATAKTPKQSEILAQQADELKQAALKYGAIGDLKQQAALTKESDSVREKLYLNQAEERKADIEKQNRAAGAMKAINSQPALDDLWSGADADHRKAFAPYFNLGLDGKPIYDDKARQSLDFFGNKAMSAKEQGELELKALQRQIEQQKADNQRLRDEALERHQKAMEAATRERTAARGNAPKKLPKDYKLDEDGEVILDPTSPTAARLATGLRKEQTTALKPIDDVQQKVTKSKELLAQSTPAADLQLQMELTNVFDKARATNMLFSANKNFGSIAGRMEGFIGRAFTGQYTDSQRSQIRQMLDGMESDVIAPARQRIGDHYATLAKTSGVSKDLVKTPDFYSSTAAKDPNAEAEAFMKGFGDGGPKRP